MAENLKEEIMETKSENKTEKNQKPIKPTKKSIFSRMGDWGHDFKSELKKVTWPSKKTVFNNTIVVLITVAIMGVFIYAVDSAFGIGIKALTSLIAG